MTVVVGLRGPNGCVLAGDSAGTIPGWGDQRERKDAKVFSLSDTVAIAYCGSYRLGQVLRHNLTLPDLPLDTDPHEWAVKKLIPDARKALKEHGILHAENGIEGLERGGFLLAVRNRLFGVESDLQVAEDEFPWRADGSGFQVVAGHMIGLGYVDDFGDGQDLRSIALAAVKTAEKVNAYVAGKPVVVETKRWTADELKLAREIVEAQTP